MRIEDGRGIKIAEGISRDIDVWYWKNLEDFNEIFDSFLIYIVLMNIFLPISLLPLAILSSTLVFFSPLIADT